VAIVKLDNNQLVRLVVQQLRLLLEMKNAFTYDDLTIVFKGAAYQEFAEAESDLFMNTAVNTCSLLTHRNVFPDGYDEYVRTHLDEFGINNDKELIDMVASNFGSTLYDMYMATTPTQNKLEGFIERIGFK